MKCPFLLFLGPARNAVGIDQSCTDVRLTQKRLNYSEIVTCNSGACGSNHSNPLFNIPLKIDNSGDKVIKASTSCVPSYPLSLQCYTLI